MMSFLLRSKFTKAGFVAGIILLGLAVSASGSSDPTQAVYYADFENPPLTEREPPIEGTRRLLENPVLPSFYVNIRYPRQEKPGDKVSFLISVGHEFWVDAKVRFVKLQLSHDGRLLKLDPSYYDELQAKRESGIESLTAHIFTVPTHEHRRVEVVCPACQEESLSTLQLSLEVEVHSEKNDGTVAGKIHLYRGHYRPTLEPAKN